MAAQGRCAVYVGMGFVFVTLITGGQSQCDQSGGQCQCDENTVPRLHASLLPHSIYSPGYPDNYPDNARCGWKLYADYGYAIHVHVVWIQMEESPDCFYDALSFHDGDTRHHRKLGTVCMGRARDIYSSSSHMYIEFISDFSVNRNGFQLEYSAIRPSDIPPTMAPPYPWPFPGDTTTMTTTTTTTESGGFSWPSYSVTALVGGVAGGLVLLFVVFALARYYMSRHYSSTRRQTARPYPPLSAPPSSTVYHNNNAVFMVSSNSTHPFHPHPASTSTSSSSGPYGGATNLAFSPFGEAPPAYFAVQQSTTLMQPGVGGEALMGATCGVPPPSYTEAMRLSHPPANHPSTHAPGCTQTHFPLRPTAPRPAQLVAQSLPQSSASSLGLSPGQAVAQTPAQRPPSDEQTDRGRLSSSSATADRPSSAVLTSADN